MSTRQEVLSALTGPCSGRLLLIISVVECVLIHVYVIKNITTCTNQKPWLTTEVSAMLRVRNAAFKSGDMVALRLARANLNRAIRVARCVHGQKIQSHFDDSTDIKHM